MNDAKYKEIMKIYVFCAIIIALMMVAWHDLNTQYGGVVRSTAEYVFCWMTFSSILYCVMTSKIKKLLKNYTIMVGIMTEIYVVYFALTGKYLNLWDPSGVNPLIEYCIVFAIVLAMEPIIVDDVARKLK